MGATISYYFQSASLQSLIDYMTSYDSLAYNINNDNNDNNINDNNLDACPNIGTTPNDLTHDTHYKLFIYIHDFPGMEYIKQERKIKQSIIQAVISWRNRILNCSVYT
jgi:hypothetical protein